MDGGVRFEGEDGDLLLGAAADRGGVEERQEDAVVGDDGDGGVELCEVGEEGEVSECMVFAFAGGAEDDDVVPMVLLAESEGLVEVVGVLFGDMVEAFGELLAEFGRERVAVADDDGGGESGMEAGDGGAVAADEVCGVAEDGGGVVGGGEGAVGEDDGEVIGSVGVGLRELEVVHGREAGGEWGQGVSWRMERMRVTACATSRSCSGPGGSSRSMMSGPW